MHLLGPPLRVAQPHRAIGEHPQARVTSVQGFLRHRGQATQLLGQLQGRAAGRECAGIDDPKLTPFDIGIDTRDAGELLPKILVAALTQVRDLLVPRQSLGHVGPSRGHPFVAATVGPTQMVTTPSTDRRRHHP